MSVCSPLLLNCFNVSAFTTFLLGTVIVPYVVYHFVASKLKWTRKRSKSLSQHYETIVGAMSAMAMLWFLGNYENTFDHVTAIFVIVGILGFGLIAEKLKDTHHHTMATMHRWNGTMHTIVLISIAVIATFAVHHVSLANQLSKDFRNRYILASLIPLSLAYLSLKVAQWENTQDSPKQLLFHLHHVHLFYALAFFTRFPEFWSKVAAGLTIGASMHGAAAFGYDGAFEYGGDCIAPISFPASPGTSSRFARTYPPRCVSNNRL